MIPSPYTGKRTLDTLARWRCDALWGDMVAVEKTEYLVPAGNRKAFPPNSSSKGRHFTVWAGDPEMYLLTGKN